MKKDFKSTGEERERSYKAFTLAEVLITLGVIGVVAAITMPNLIKNYQKQVTVSKLKETYSIISQAVKLSEIENQTCNTWNYPSERSNPEMTLEWFEKYLKPYLKSVRTENYTGGIYVYLSNGVILRLWYNGNNHFHVFVYLNGKDKTVAGKDEFVYFLGDNATNDYMSNTNSFIPYNSGIKELSRDILINDEKYGCNKTSTHNEPRRYCAYLIMYDSWQIKDDYPYFN